MAKKCTLILLFFQPFVVFSGEIMSTGFPPDSAIVLNRTRDDTILQFNRFGSFGAYNNGIRAVVRAGNYNLLAGYNYTNFDGYRVHSNAYAHNLNLVVETTPTVNTRLRILGNYINGEARMPGSLTKSEFGQDPLQADPRAVGRDEKRATSKGNLNINYSALFGKFLNQRIEISGNGQIEYFIRSTKEYKITTRYILGLQARYVLYGLLWRRKSEFSAGAELFHQPETKEEYENLGGIKSDWIEQIEIEKTSIASCFVSENYELVKKKLYVLLTARYDHVIYSVAQELAPSLSDTKRYNAFTPEIELNYTVIPAITLFTSCERNFRNPTDKELESPNQSSLYNAELRPQTSTTLSIGMKSAFVKNDTARFFRALHFDAVVFRSFIDDEIVPYEIFGDEFYRNASKTNRVGFTLNGRLEIFTGLTFSADYTYSRFIYRTYTANAWETDTSGTLVLNYHDFAGKTEPDIPVNNLALSLLYKHPAGKKTAIFAKIGYSYISGLWVDDANTDQTRPYSLVNAALGTDLKLGHFMLSVSAGVNNLFDQVYVGDATTNSADKRYYNAGAPQSFFGSVNIGYLF
ncbi:MAG: TonB-dependent receptor [Bacteroidetes bacterium]|nr:TonB-dependent receptor [Bacteroidota bacterium]